jgi:hypothetical protein
MTYTTTDKDGWSYAATYGSLETEFSKATSSAENRMLDFVRRRRWTRQAVRKQVGTIHYYKQAGGYYTLL